MSRPKSLGRTRNYTAMAYHNASIPFAEDRMRNIGCGIAPKMVYRVNIPSENDISRVPSIHPTNVETVASYNWVVSAHGDHKRILVPG